MTYTFYCDKSHRFAYTKEYRTKSGLKRAIMKLEKEGWCVTVTCLAPRTIYKNGKFN